MKRNTKLKPLTDDHHHGLVLCLRLRKTVRKDLKAAEAIFWKAWETELQPHFRIEDDVILPEMAHASSETHPEIVRTCADHVALRLLVRLIERSSASEKESLLLAFADRLEKHIRYEERTLLGFVESLLGEGGLTRLKLVPRH